MTVSSKTKQQLLDELTQLRKQLQTLKRSKTALTKSEARYQTLMESTPDFVLTLDSKGLLTYINPMLEKVTGYAASELEGLPFTAILAPERRESAAKRFKQAAKGTGGSHYETEIIHKDGKRISVELAVSTLQDKQGQLSGHFGIGRDITERKRTEEALKRDAAEISDFYHNAPCGYHSLGPDGTFLRMNDTELRWLGYTRNEIIKKKKWSELLTPEGKVLYHKTFPVLKERGWIDNLEFELIRKDGTKLPVLLNATAIKDEKGHYIMSRSTLFDMTDRKRLEEERHSLWERLQRAEKMEALGTLAGGVAHDLNNILGILVGYSELLLMETPEGSPLRRHARNILQGGERAAAIIQDLLTLARRGVSVSEPLNLNILISNVLRLPEFEALKSRHSAITFKTDLEPDLLNIKGSPVHLNKTVMNLLSNAAEAIAGAGEIVIRTENRYVDRPIPGYESTRDGEYSVLTVSDTGAGIPATNLERIFEPFYTKKIMGRSGTGLGLAVVWGTVKDHDGYIDVQSDVGKGSVFTLYFPATREQLPSVDVAVSRETYMGGGERILVVDDVEGQRQLASSMLRNLGYEVDTVSSGEEAVQYIKTRPVDLIVLDMIMDPGIDGLETYQRILKTRPRQKAIIVSGFAMTERVERAQQLGAGAYVRKPYLIEKIGLAVRKELDKGRSGITAR